MGRSAKKQAKHARKVLGFYRQAFGLERPYQLILHGGFIQHCLQQKVFFREQLIEIHDAPVTLHVTRDTRQELRKLGPSHDGAAVVCKRLINLAYEPPTDSEEDEEDGAEQLAAPERVGELELQDRSDKSESDEDEDDSDGDDDEAEGDGAGTGTGRSELSAGQRRRRALAAHKARERARLDEEAEAARHPDPAFAATNHALRALMREQPGQYIVAVQDGPLRAQLRRIPGVPLVYADRGSGQICFEQPSKASERWAAKVEQSKQVASEAERKLYGGQLVDILDQAAQGQLKKRKQKGVNPLSAKKKQKKDPAQGTGTDQTSETEGEVSVRRLRQRERQRRRVRQRVRHKRPDAESVSTDEERDEDGEAVAEAEDGVAKTYEQDTSSESDSDSEDEDGSEDQEEEMEPQLQPWEQPAESIRCYCSLPADTQAYGDGKRHFERGPTVKYPNRSRKFFCCGRGMEEEDHRARCSFFAWAEPPADLSIKKQEQERAEAEAEDSKAKKRQKLKESGASLSDKLLQAGKAGDDPANSSGSATAAATTMADLQGLTPAAALRKLRKLDRQISELKKKAEEAAEASFGGIGGGLTAQQKEKLGRADAVKAMLVEAEKAAVQAAFAAPQLVIKEVAAAPEEEGTEPADGAGAAETGSGAAPAPTAAAAVTAPAATTTTATAATAGSASGSGGGGSFLSVGVGMDPVSVWYTSVANWIRSAPAGGTGLGSLGSAVPPPPGAPKLKKLILRAKHLRISPDGQVELMQQ